MSFIDSLQWNWMCFPLVMKILFSALFVGGLLCVILSFITKEIMQFLAGFFTIFSFFVVLLFFSSPTTEKLVSMYEYGEINKSEFVKFLPYAIEFDEKEARGKKRAEYQKSKDSDALKVLMEEEASRRNEALALVKKIKGGE